MQTKPTDQDRTIEQEIRNRERLAAYHSRYAKHLRARMAYLRRSANNPMFLRPQAD
jgi:hypothetical protein